MNQVSQIQFSANKMVIRTKTSPVLVNFIIGFLAVAIAIIPIASVIMMVKMGEPPKFGLFIGVGLFGFLSFRMTRHLFWNMYGTEVLLFEKERVSYYADFRYFQDSHQSLLLNDIKVSVREIEEWDESLGKLVITSPLGEIEFAINAPVEDAYFAQRKCQDMITLNAKSE